MTCTTEFIPVQAGQQNLLNTQDLISDFLGQVVYEQSGNKIIFHKDIVVDGVKAVTMKLVLMDISQYDEHTPLPLSADLENQIVQEVWQSFLPIEAQLRIVDSYKDNTQANGNNR